MFSTAHLSVALAMPKSITLGTGVPSCSITSTFDGFRSRWMTPFWCACCTAWQTARNNSSRSLVVSRLRSQYSVIGTPSTYSITKYGRPLVVAPASKTRAMFGWSIIASACRSASKRASTWAVSMPSLMTLSATRRRMGSRCSARYTVPMPPSPRDSNNSIAAEVVIPGRALGSASGLSSGFVGHRNYRKRPGSDTSGTVRRDRRNPIPLRTEGNLTFRPK